jgi:hypothetical protein
MAFLGPGGDAVVRLVHIGAVILWIGLLHFAVLIRPRILAGLSEGGMREVAPHIAARFVPWVLWMPLLALGSGAILYVDRIDTFGLAGVGWGLHLSVFLAVVMVGITHGVSLPAMRRAAGMLQGAPPPPPSVFVRLTVAGWVLVVLSWIVLLLMVLSAHWSITR